MSAVSASNRMPANTKPVTKAPFRFSLLKTVPVGTTVLLPAVIIMNKIFK